MLTKVHHCLADGIAGLRLQTVARALLADRPILLLDEPTAHLDHATAAALTAELLDHTRDRAAIVVTHRPDDLAEIPAVTLDRSSSGPGFRAACSVEPAVTPGRAE